MWELSPLSSGVKLLVKWRMIWAQSRTQGANGLYEVPSGVLGTYLGILFTSDGRMERETCRWFAAASVVKRRLSRNSKVSIYQSIYVQPSPIGHELWPKERALGLAGLSLSLRLRTSGATAPLHWGGSGIWWGCLLDACYPTSTSFMGRLSLFLILRHLTFLSQWQSLMQMVLNDTQNDLSHWMCYSYAIW